MVMSFEEKMLAVIFAEMTKLTVAFGEIITISARMRTQVIISAGLINPIVSIKVMAMLSKEQVPVHVLGQ